MKRYAFQYAPGFMAVFLFFLSLLKSYIHKIPFHDGDFVIGPEGPHRLGIGTYVSGRSPKQHLFFINACDPFLQVLHVPVEQQGHLIRRQNYRPEAQRRNIRVFFIHRFEFQGKRKAYLDNIVRLPLPFQHGPGIRLCRKAHVPRRLQGCGLRPLPSGESGN